MKTSTNRKLNVTVVRTVTHIETEHWYGYPTFRTHGYELHLSFYGGKPFLNFSRYNSDGWVSGGSSGPLERFPQFADAAKILMRRHTLRYKGMYHRNN